MNLARSLNPLTNDLLLVFAENNECQTRGKKPYGLRIKTGRVAGRRSAIGVKPGDRAGLIADGGDVA